MVVAKRWTMLHVNFLETFGTQVEANRMLFLLHVCSLHSHECQYSGYVALIWKDFAILDAKFLGGVDAQIKQILEDWVHKA